MMEDPSLFGLALLVLGGLVAGVINTLAGNGSAITLSLLIFLGLPADWANATNRIGVITQTGTAVASLKRSKRNRLLLKDGMWLLWPTLLGSAAGALAALQAGTQLMEWVIFGVMLFILSTLVSNKGTWLQATDVAKSHRTAKSWISFFLIGFYGGFIQMGIGILMLASLVLASGYSLRDANVIKLLQALILAIPPLFIFVAGGKINWPAGLALAAGQAMGALLGTRYFLQLPGANVFIRRLLIIILVVAIARLGWSLAQTTFGAA